MWRTVLEAVKTGYDGRMIAAQGFSRRMEPADAFRMASDTDIANAEIALAERRKLSVSSCLAVTKITKHPPLIVVKVYQCIAKVVALPMMPPTPFYVSNAITCSWILVTK